MQYVVRWSRESFFSTGENVERDPLQNRPRVIKPEIRGPLIPYLTAKYPLAVITAIVPLSRLLFLRGPPLRICRSHRVLVTFVTRDKLYYTAGGGSVHLRSEVGGESRLSAGGTAFHAVLLPRSFEVVPTAANLSAAAWPMELRRRHAGLVADEMYCHLIVNRLFTEPVINTALLLLHAVACRRRRRSGLATRPDEMTVNLRYAATAASPTTFTSFANSRGFTRKKSSRKSAIGDRFFCDVICNNIYAIDYSAIRMPHPER